MGLAATAGLLLPSSVEARWTPPAEENLRRFHGISSAIIKLAENYSQPSLIGPRMSENLVALVQHMYTEEEAEILQYLTPWSSRTAKYLADRVQRPVPEVEAILLDISKQKNSLLTYGGENAMFAHYKTDNQTIYNILPLMLGTPDLVLVKPDKSQYTEWHQEFGRLLGKIFDNGEFNLYFDHRWGLTRYIPSNPAIRDNPVALPSDNLAEILDHYDYIAMGHCLCTYTARASGRSCDRNRPDFTCMAMGKAVAEPFIRSGMARRVERTEALEIRAQAEEQGLVNYVLHLDDEKIGWNLGCSCCGCCCMLLRFMNDFNKPAIFVRPHFRPKIDFEKCNNCGICVERCNTGAHQVKNFSSHTWDPNRCIGCGLCVTACPVNALTLEEVKGYRPPYQSYSQVFAAESPTILNAMSREKIRRGGT